MTGHKPMDPDTKRSLRDAFGRFATGVTVVTTCQPDGTPRGFTANSFTSVSLEPPLLLVCIGKAALSCDTFATCTHFTVNILADTQKEISGLFASQSAEKFDIAQWHPNAQGVPLIEGTLASFSCAHTQVVDAGDHLILIGQVLDFETSDGKPLGYYKGAYIDIGLDRAVTEAAAAGDASIAAVLVHENGLILAEEQNGTVTLPTARSIETLTKDLTAQGLTPHLAHLYAVYQVTDTGAHRIVYHGVAQGTLTGGLHTYNLDDLPLDLVPDEAERSLLRRFALENQHGTFGIYHGTEVEGVVHRLSGNHKYHI